MRRNAGLEGVSLRTFSLVGHASVGKTQLAEAMLHASGVVRQLGRVDDNDVLLDFEPEESGRHGSVFPAVAWLPWADGVLHVIDTPGNEASAYVARLAREGADADLLVVSASDGIELGAERVLRSSRHDDRALVAVINKMDRCVDLEGLVADMAYEARRKTVLLQLPLLDDDDAFVGVIDLLELRARRYDADAGGTWSDEPVPTHLVSQVMAERERLLEAVAVTDEALLETYLEHLDLAPEQVWAGLARAVRLGMVLPVLLTCATGNVGAHAVLDAMMRLSPDPLSWRLPIDSEGRPRFVAQWIATRIDEDGAPVALLRVRHGEITENQVWHGSRTGATSRMRKLYQVRGPRRAKMRYGGPGAIVASWDLPPGRPGDAFTDGPHVPLEPPRSAPKMAWLRLTAHASTRVDAFRRALDAAKMIDPSVRVEGDVEQRVVTLSGSHARQLSLFVGWMRSRFDVAVSTSDPPVAYIERPRRPVQGVHGLHRKEEGGLVSELGEVWFDLAPLPITAPFAFSCIADPDDLPAKYVPSIQRGASAGLSCGPHGFEVRGVEVTCVSGEYDMMESQGEHFEQAARAAMATALDVTGTELWEPWSDVHVFVPGSDVGTVIADLSAHRARVLGMQVADDETSIRVHCPDTSLRSLSGRLESLTRGRGWFVARPSHLDAVPSSEASDVARKRPGTSPSVSA